MKFRTSSFKAFYVLHFSLYALLLAGCFDEPEPAYKSVPEGARIYLKEQGLADLKGQSFDASKIDYLNLDRNRLASLPDALPTGLRWLRLNGNALSSLPESIGALVDLRRIYLNDNALEALPASFGALKALEDVALAGNRLTAFPAVLVSLPHLRNLDLRGNGSITELPPDIGDMKALRTLTLTGCRLPKEERDRIRNFQPPVSGEDIMTTFGIGPCREIGIIKDAIKDAILDGQIPNQRDAAWQMMLRLGADLNLKKVK